jgi:hypothetical protein
MKKQLIVTGLSLKQGRPVVCYNASKEPSTWGTISEYGSSSSTVAYGDHAPIWGSNFWANEFLVGFNSIEEAMKVVRDFEDSQPNR